MNEGKNKNITISDDMEEKPSTMLKIATFIVDRRNLFFLLFGIAIIFCLIAAKWVKVENSLAAYLPDDAETTIGLDLMDEQFITYGTAKVMVMNIDYDEAEKLADSLRDREDVSMLSFDRTEEHFHNFSALFDITFIYPEDDDRALAALDDIQADLAGYDIYVSTSMGDAAAEQINAEMQVVTVIVAIIVLSVLIFTSQTYAEVPVLILTF